VGKRFGHKTKREKVDASPAKMMIVEIPNQTQRPDVCKKSRNVKSIDLGICWCGVLGDAGWVLSGKIMVL
jgi:hypothetical protein